EILGEVDHDGDVAALPGEARTPAARKHGRTVLAAQGDGLDHLLDRLGEHDSDGNLPVVRTVGRVQRAVPAAEPHLALDLAAHVALERPDLLVLQRTSTPACALEHMAGRHAAYRSAS